jgi:hypothetical protein
LQPFEFERQHLLFRQIFAEPLFRKSCRLETLGFERNAQMFRDVFGIDVALEIRQEV